MKANEAVAKGYSYSAISDLGRNGHTFEAQREEIKKLGYKCVTVNERVSQYSRSNPGMGYRELYIEQRYFDDKEKERLARQLSFIDERKQKALEAYQAALAKIDEEATEMNAKLEKLNAKTYNKK